ncbi:MAG: polyprenyl synthetase family protein [Candidatus Nezhaarchaeales archaeon]
MDGKASSLSNPLYLLNEVTASLLMEFEHRMKYELTRLTPPSLLEPVLYALSGGKRIRPLILLLASSLTGKPSLDPFPAAITVELLHCASLIHDDIIDREKSRRGRDPFHVKFGFELGVIGADLMLALSSSLISRYSGSRLMKAMLEELSRSAMEMCEGELLETYLLKSGRIEWRQYLKLIKLKTAPLFRASAKLGGLIAVKRARAWPVTQLAKYGLLVGMAFQIRDDVLDAERGEGEIIRLLGASRLRVLERLSRSLADRAKLALSPFRPSPFKSTLLELADVAIRRDV